MCRELASADLRGFRLTWRSLLQLVTANRASLESLTLPAGVGGEQLATLLSLLQNLRRLSVAVSSDCSGDWMQSLPASVLELNIRGEGAQHQKRGSSTSEVRELYIRGEGAQH